MASFTVTNNSDSGLGSLRQAIQDANTTIGFDSIDFDAGLIGETITLTSGELEITDNLFINGLGAEQLAISGNNASRIFNVDDGDENNLIEVGIDGLTITNGLAGLINDPFVSDFSGGGVTNSEILTLSNSIISDNEAPSNNIGGGGIFNDSDATLTLDNSIVTDNIAARIGTDNIFGSPGGGIANFGTLLVNNSTISNNFGGEVGGGIANLGGLENESSATAIITNSSIFGNKVVLGSGGGGIASINPNAILEISNSTIFDNEAFADEGSSGIGGGVAVFGGSATISNSTISGNRAIANENAEGGGVFSFNNVTIENTIVAGNSGNTPDVSGDFNSNGYNLIGNGTGSSGFTASGDQVGTSDNPIDPLLGSLQNNGGSTSTLALLPNSPAIDSGNPNFVSPPAFDQRGSGFPRILDGNGDGIAIVDIGAFEAQQSASVPEPSSVLGLSVLVILGVGSFLKRKFFQL